MNWLLVSVSTTISMYPFTLLGYGISLFVPVPVCTNCRLTSKQTIQLGLGVEFNKGMVDKDSIAAYESYLLLTKRFFFVAIVL